MTSLKTTKALIFFGFCLGCFAFSALAQGTQPLVAIHYSELTQAMETQAASNGTPTGSGYTGNQWWNPDWHYFVAPESLKEALRSDGTPFAVLGDSNITAGALLSNGVPVYPILFSLSSEAMRNDEIAPLTNYVAAGGFLFIGGSSFTRNTNGSTRGDFAFANAMGVHMAVPGMTNWGSDFYLTTQTSHRIINDIPAGTNTWRMGAFADETSWGTSPTHNYLLPHDIWQVTAGGATVLATGDNGPYILLKQYGKGWIIYDAAFEPLIGEGGFAPGMYAYMILRRSIEWAFETANLPIPKISPWPYQYDSAYMVRHDLENFGNEMADIVNSAAIEFTNGAKGDYYLCTGTVRQDMSSLYNTNIVITNMRWAVSHYGATVGPHNGGFRDPNNPSLMETNGVGSSYDFWHWGPDEAMNITTQLTNALTGTVYPNGVAYAKGSLSSAFLDIESWLTGLESSNMRVWCAPNFNGTRENAYSNQAALGVKIAGEQKDGPFPHWTLSTGTAGKRYATLTEPVSDWFVGGLVAQSLEPWHPPGVQTSGTLHAAIDYYYNQGLLINFYSHTLATGEGDAGQLVPDYITYCANTNLHPRLWSANAIGVYQWWLARSNAQINVSYTTNGSQSVATYSVTGASDPNTSVELLIPSTTSFCSLQVVTNGVLAGTNNYRVNGQLVKVRVGASVTNVQISYYPLGSPVKIFSQNFDSVTAPTLPGGWTSSATGAESPWVTQSVVTNSDTPSNSVFVADVPGIGQSDLTSPVIALPVGQSQLAFRQNYNLESDPGDPFDGGVLSISIASGPFVDILAAGGSFITGGYVGIIDTNYFNPLAGRQAWSGNSGGYITTIVTLPASASGTNIQLRWSCGTDTNNAFTGWRIDTISITNRVCLCCTGSNSPPTLPAQSSVSVPELTPLIVTNTANDPDPGAILYYQLISSPANANIDTNGIITWTPSQLQSHSTNTLTTVVTDNGGLSATNIFQVTVTEVNVAPTLGNISQKTVNELATIIVTNSAAESNIDSVTTGYTLVNSPGNATINSNGVITWTPTQAQSHSTNNFTTTVTNFNPYDSVNPTLVASNSFSVLVKEVNVAPTLGSISQKTVNELATILVTNSTTESNINSITTGYTLTNSPGNATINSNGVITWTPTQAQSHSTNNFTTIVTNHNPYDSLNPNLVASNSFSVVVKEVNVAPTLPNISQQTVNELATLKVTNTAVESNLNSVTTGYTLINSPGNATINSNGVITWIPTQAQSHSTNNFTTIVTNHNPYDALNPNLIASNSFTVVVKEINVAPTLPNLSQKTVNELATLTVTNTAVESNIDSATTGYALVNSPTNAAINSNGIITWTPTQAQSHSTNNFTTIVTNFNAFDPINPTLIASNNFSVVVKEVNVPPTLGVIAPQTVTELTTLVVANPATESNINSVTTGYALVNSPTNASIDSNGIITWTPTQAQSHSTNNFTAIVTNHNPYDSLNPNLIASNSFSVAVIESNVAPVLPAQNNTNINEFATLIITNTAAEPNLDSVTLGYALVNSPTNASIDTNGVITWTPTQAQSRSTNNFTTIVTNFNPFDSVNPTLVSSNSFTVAVMEANIAPGLGVIAPQTVNELATLTVTNTATEPNLNSITMGYTLVNSPTNASIDGNGVITWTPTQAQSHSTNNFTTVVTNFNPFDSVNPTLVSSNSFTVAVMEMNLSPTLGTIAPQTVNELTTLTVTNTATESNIISLTTGYSLVNSPTNASIDSNGVITWTPTQAQSHSTNLFTTVVTNFNPFDSVNPTLISSNSFTVVVTEVNIAPTLGVIAPQTVNELAILIVTNTAAEPNIDSVTTGYALANSPTNATISSNGVITWIPTQAQSHSTNLFTTIVTNFNPFDSVNPTLVSSNTFTVSVLESNVPPVLPVQSNTNINELATLTVTNTATEPNLDSVTIGYALVNSPTNASIDTNGIITWIPAQTQSPSTNVFTTVVTNNNPYDLVNPTLLATNSFSVVVNESNSAPVLPPQNTVSVFELTTLLVTNTAAEPNIHSVTLGYSLLAGPTNASIDTNGVITWTPAQAQSPGTNVFTAVVTNQNPYDTVNPKLVASNTFNVIVLESNVPPVLANQFDAAVDENVTLVITNSVTEPNIHSVTLGFGLLNAPQGATIDSNGVFSWTPSLLQDNTTNLVTTIVTNNNPFDLLNPQLTTTSSFNVFVTDTVLPPLITSIKLTNGVATVSWTTVPGHTYQLQFQDQVSDPWSNAAPAVFSTGTVASATNSIGNAPNRLYQVLTSHEDFHFRHH